VLLANNIGMLWDVYKVMPAEELTTLGAWLGIIAFSFQIYFDFSGYSDMAIGLGRMIGFEFLENFNYPYISKSITEFWRRWHISLGTWFREYVYIPLGGNRKGTLRTFLNIFIVWAITGFWHGASWNYLLWGIYYAILLMIEKAFLLDWLKKAPAIVSHLYTLVLVVIGWALFAIEDLGSCITYISAMLGGGAGFTNSTVSYYFMGYLPSLIIMAFASTPLGVKLLNRLPVKSRQIAIPVLIAFTLLISTAYLVDATYNPFLYFRF
jgi:alginate O-acetyltransferase complex protein AlgI